MSMIWAIGLALICPLKLFAQAPSESAGEHAITIDHYRQLLADDFLIESLHEVERVLHPGTKRPEPVIIPDKPWEHDTTYVYGTAMFDEQEHIFKIWYQVFYKDPPLAYTLYATSKDGIHWHKPALGIVEIQGSKQNNVLLKGEIATVIKDTSEADPTRRYKMLVFQRPGYHSYFSSDGIHWSQSKIDPAIPNGDVSNVTWDKSHHRFVAMTKQPHKEGRAVFISYSEDFEHWTAPKLVFAADLRDQQLAKASGGERMDIYGMPAIPYQDIYLAFPWMFTITGKGAKDTGGDGVIDIQFATSRDLETWQRPLRNPIIPRGLAGSFDDEMVFSASNLVEREKEVWMYYGAWDGPHGTFKRSARIGLVTWRKDGFVSLTNGSFAPGDVTTRLLRVNGAALKINGNFSHKNSYLKAELLDEQEKPLPGFSLTDAIPFHGDSLNAKLGWRGGHKLAELSGQNVRIRFHLLGGDLYSFSME